jgi:hypothetical protein
MATKRKGRNSHNPEIQTETLPDDGLTGRNRAKLATDILRHLASLQQIEIFPEVAERPRIYPSAARTVSSSPGFTVVPNCRRLSRPIRYRSIRISS